MTSVLFPGLLRPARLASPSLRAAERPHFIIINIDGPGSAEIGPFGSKLNRPPAPVCSLSRAALLIDRDGKVGPGFEPN